MFTTLEAKRLFTASDMSGDLTSTAFNALTIVSFNIVSEMTAGTPVGNLILQGEMEGGSVWKALESVAISAAGFDIRKVLDPAAFQFRLFWDSTSGSGTINSWLVARVFKRRGDLSIEAL